MMNSTYDEGRNKIEEEKQILLAQAREGIEMNVPLKNAQKKYLKNMLLFSIMRVSSEKTTTPKNLRSKANALFKKMFISLLETKKILRDDNPDEEDYEEEEAFYDNNINVSLNNIQLSPKIEKSSVMRWLTPKNIMLQIRYVIMGFTSRDVVSRLKAIKKANENHRETMEEYLERLRNGRALSQEQKRQLDKQHQREAEREGNSGYQYQRGRGYSR